MGEQRADWTVILDNVRTESTLNKREHWGQRAKRSKSQRAATIRALAAVPRLSLPLAVTLTRVCPPRNRIRDDDNLVSSMKAIRDGVAEWHGTDDSDERWRWVVKQRAEKGSRFAVEIDLAGDPADATRAAAAEAADVHHRVRGPEPPAPATSAPPKAPPPPGQVRIGGKVHAVWGRRRGSVRTWCNDRVREPEPADGEPLSCSVCTRRWQHARTLGRSRKTAIRRTELSKPARALVKAGLLVGRVLDFGCGHGDLVRFGGLERAEQWDPYWLPFTDPAGPYDSILCSYVVNTIGPSERSIVLQRLRHLLGPGGKAYVVVRRDVEGSTKTKTGSEQTDVRLDLPSVMHEPGAFEVYELAR